MPGPTEPFYNKVFLGDCFDIIKELPDESIDLIATDPPYQINYQRNEWDKKDSIDFKILAKQFKRVLKKNGNILLFQGWSEVVKTKSIFDSLFEIKNWIIYDRIKGRGTKRNLVSTREDILWYINGDEYTYNKIPSDIKKKTGGTIGKKNGCEYRSMSNVWTDISPIVPWSSERLAHPTQKPIKIMDRIISIFSNEGDIVFDPFCGCGTTIIACQKLNRKWIGIEKEKKYYDIILQRLNNGLQKKN